MFEQIVNGQFSRNIETVLKNSLNYKVETAEDV